MRAAAVRGFLWLSVGFFLGAFPAAAQTQPDTSSSAGQTSSEQQTPQAAQQAPGTISGTIADQSGAPIGGAHVKVTSKDGNVNQEAVTGDDGAFEVANLAAGEYQLAITSEGLATKTVSVTLHAGEAYAVPKISMAVASEVTRVQVLASREDVAEAEIKVEEKQRVLGVIPNFYVSYDPKAAPLNSKQKFELAWRTIIDPVTFGLNGAIAGIEQASNQFGGYGQGAEGYGKRYGASYADLVTGTLIGGAILPSVLKQDPRYFYKGTGTKKSRVLYAIANSVICKGDNGRWQPNYSGILGSLAAGGISNLYYPKEDRNGAGLTFENAAIGIGATAAANLLQEFVIPKLTPNFSKRPTAGQP